MIVMQPFYTLVSVTSYSLLCLATMLFSGTVTCRDYTSSCVDITVVNSDCLICEDGACSSLYGANSTFKPTFDGTVVNPTSRNGQCPSGGGSGGGNETSAGLGGLCFSGDSRVHVLGKGTIRMQDLQVNDLVFTGSNPQDGKVIFQPVYSFGHLNPTVQAKFIRLYHNGIAATHNFIELSPAHLLYLAGQENPVRADTVRVGDTLIQSMLWGNHTGSRSSHENVRVTYINYITRKGAYQPLTPCGNIVVNEIAASAYVSIQHVAPSIVGLSTASVMPQQMLFHWWLAPYRMFCMGLSTKLCEDDYNDEGIIYWLGLGQSIAEFGDRQAFVVQVVGLAIFFAIFCPVMVVEAFFGVRLGLVGMLLTGWILLRYGGCQGALKRNSFSFCKMEK